MTKLLAITTLLAISTWTGGVSAAGVSMYAVEADRRVYTECLEDNFQEFKGDTSPARDLADAIVGLCSYQQSVIYAKLKDNKLGSAFTTSAQKNKVEKDLQESRDNDTAQDVRMVMGWILKARSTSAH